MFNNLAALKWKKRAKNCKYPLSAYDMVASTLVVNVDDEELALTLNGKKKKIRRKDFLDALGRFDIDQK